MFKIWPRGDSTTSHLQDLLLQNIIHNNSTINACISQVFSSLWIFRCTYLLTPWCRVLPEKLTGLQLVKKFPTFHGTRRFINALTSVRHLSLSWANPIQFIYPHPTSWRSNTFLYFPLAHVHQRQCPPWFNYAEDSPLLIIPKYLAPAIFISINNNTWRGHTHLRVDGQLNLLWSSVCLPSFDGIQHSFLSISVPWSVDRLLGYYDLGYLHT